MTQINWGMLPNNSFQNALGMGIQMGQEVRARQDMKEQRNALAAFATNPNEETAVAAAQYQPGAVMGWQERQAEAERAGRIQTVAQAAYAGDNQALAELFTLDPNLWTKLDGRQQETMKNATSYMGQAAFRIGQLPEDQRPAAWQAAVAQAEQGGMDIPAYLEGYSPEVLSSAIDRAKLTENYIQRFDPKYMAVPEGDTLVDTRNPAAVSQFGAGGAPQQQPAQPAPTGVENTFTFEQVLGALNSLGPQGTADWIRRNGITVRVNSPQEASQLPRGTRYIDPNGVMRVIE